MANVCRDDREGQSCQATADCGVRLVCRREVCVGRYADVPGQSDSGGSGAAGGWGDWRRFRLGQGTHLYFGVSLAPMVSIFHSFEYGRTSDALGGFGFAFRFGAFFDQVELGLELSPKTTAFDFEIPANFVLNIHAGRFVRLSDRFFWPLRFGIGMVAGDTFSDGVQFQTRADLLGFAFNIGHILLEFDLPSYRFTTDFDRGGFHSWLFVINTSYVL